jgi:peptide chain release factor subunit 1
MEITKELRTLARFTSETLPVLSVYLNTQWRDQHQRERAITFLERHLRQAQALEPETPEALESLTHDLARLTQWSQQHLHNTGERATPGVALFACAGADLWIELPAPVPFEDEFTIADRPMLRQLARLDDDYTNALLVLVDSRTARVYEVVLGGFLAEVDFASDVPRRHKQGGWAQARYQRHVKEHVDRHHKEVADYVASYMQSHPHTQLLVSGPTEIVANFCQWLPPSLQAQVIETASLAMHDDRQRILEVARDALQRHEREVELATVERLLNSAAAGGLATVGLQETLAAVNTGRVHQLVLQRDLQVRGGRCLNCSNLSEDLPAQCSVCGGEVSAVELGEAMVSGVLQTDGFVEVVEPTARLATYEGVGAFLRYR